jgi:hypothetical protein
MGNQQSARALPKLCRERRAENRDFPVASYLSLCSSCLLNFVEEKKLRPTDSHSNETSGNHFQVELLLKLPGEIVAVTDNKGKPGALKFTQLSRVSLAVMTGFSDGK